MRDLPDAAVTAFECEHHWVSGHEPGHRLYWVRLCSQCHAADWNDLDEQIDVLTAAAAAESATAERERWLAADDGTAAVYHLGAHDERKAILAAVSELLQRPHTGKDIADLIRARGAS